MALSVFAAAAEAPDRTALIADGAVLTFADLADRVRAAVAWLRVRELDGPAPVGVVASNDVATVEMLHALLALGTPALLFHPRLTGHERYALRAAARPATVVGREWKTEGAPRESRGSRRPSRPEPGPDPAPPADDERTLAIIATSGTSGRSKGVVLSRRAFAASAAASAGNLGWEEDDRWLLPLPLAHVGGLSILTRCLLARRAVVLAPDADAGRVATLMVRHRATLLSVVPTVLARILDSGAAPEPPEALRAVLLGGAAASPALLERAADLGWPVLTTYGLSEACSQVTTQQYGTVNRGEAGSGPPLPGIGLRIGDDDAIQVRGPTLFSGYLPQADDPFLPGGWLPTGDRGRLDADGNLHVLGRRADRIVTGGENVDPVEVERALEGLAGIRAACAFGVPDEEWGEVVAAAVVLEPDAPSGTGPKPAQADPSAAPTPALGAELRGLRDLLAPFKLPRRVAILDALPLNATGKVDRTETARRAGPRLQEI